MDRQEATFIVMSVEQRKLLMPMHDIQRVVDIQRDRTRWPLVAGAVSVDQGVGHAYDFAKGGGILPARDGWLGAKIGAAVRQPSAGQLEARVGAQVVEIVGILVAASDRQHARTQDIG